MMSQVVPHSMDRYTHIAFKQIYILYIYNNNNNNNNNNN